MKSIQGHQVYRLSKKFKASASLSLPQWDKTLYEVAIESNEIFSISIFIRIHYENKLTKNIWPTDILQIYTRVHSILDIGVICFQFWTGPDLKIAPFERVLKNLLDTGPWD